MAGTTGTTSKADNAINLWESLKGIVLFLGIYLFFVGWVYLATYFSQFGFKPVNIKIEVHDYYVYGFFAIQKSTPLLLILTAFFVLSVTMLLIQKGARFRYGMLAVAGIIIFPLSFFATQSTASAMVKELTHGTLSSQIPNVNIYFKKEYLSNLVKPTGATPFDTLLQQLHQPTDTSRQEALTSLYSAMRRERLVEIYQNDQTLYVFCNTTVSETDPNQRILVYAFDKKDIEFYYTQVFQ